MKRIAILSTAPSINNESYDIAKFDTTLKSKLGSKFIVDTILFSDLVIRFSSDKYSIIVASKKIELHEYDYVFFKSWIRLSELAHVIVDYLILNNIPFQPNELRYHHSHGKLSEAVFFYKEKYLFPETIYSINPNLIRMEYDKLHHKNVVIKDADAFGGQDNHLIGNAKELNDVIGERKEINYIMQPFIPNLFDYRIFIIGDETPLIIKRTRTGSGHLNNTSMGAHADLCNPNDINNEILNKSITIAKKMGRSFAGVDVMLGDDGKYYFLEVNKSPQVASGAFINEKTDVFAKGIAGMVITELESNKK